MSYPAVQPGSPIFDSRQLERWKIPPSRLPPGSEIRLRTPSPWTLYRWPILGALAVLALQSALIVGLLVQHRYRRSAEGEVRSLHGRLLTTYEQERRRLARELHDDLTQRLARLAIDAAQVERQNPTLDGNPTLRLMRGELIRLSDDVHTLSRQLHPSILDDLGLAEALRSEVERFGRAERIEVDLQLAGTPAELPAETALCLYRVAQEALRNVAHHAHARRVEVVLRWRIARSSSAWATTASASIPSQGAGSGARPREPARTPASRRRGQLEITSAPGKGTVVLARVPVAGAGRTLWAIKPRRVTLSTNGHRGSRGSPDRAYGDAGRGGHTARPVLTSSPRGKESRLPVRLRGDPQVGLERLPALRELLLRPPRRRAPGR